MTATSEKPFMIERLVAALSYLTMGLIGFVWLLLGIFTKAKVRPFLKYHIFQSIFISIAYFLLIQLLGLMMNILSIIPFINILVLRITFYLNMPIIARFSLIELLIDTVILYLVVTAFQGKFSYLPWISEIIKTNIRE